MLFNKSKYRLLSCMISVILIHAFLLSNLISAAPLTSNPNHSLARWTAIRDHQINIPMRARMLREGGFIRVAKPDTLYEMLLRNYNAQACRLQPDLYLVTPEINGDDHALVEAVTCLETNEKEMFYRTPDHSPQGTPANLLCYMFVNNISKNNPKAVKEMAQERGFSESTVYRELKALRGVRLIGGGKENLYYLTDWALELSLEEFERMVEENHELSKPNPSDEEIETACIRIDRTANIRSCYPGHDEWIAARGRFYGGISENGRLVEDLRRLGYSIDDAIDAIFTQKTYNIARGFGVGQYSILEPAVVHQRLLIEADLENLIRHRLNQEQINRDFVIYGFGIGEEPNEAETILKSFYSVLKKLQEDPCSWNVRFIGFDIDSDIIRNTERLFKPINEKNKEVLKSVLGIEDAGIKAEFYQVNLYDVTEFRRVLHKANLENVKADYILARYLNYENWEVEKGNYHKDLSFIKDKREKSLERLSRILQAYLTYRNSLLILGKPKQADTPGTRYVIDPDEIKLSGGRALIPPGTDFIGLEVLGVLEYEDQNAVENAGLLAFKESARSSVPGMSESEFNRLFDTDSDLSTWIDTAKKKPTPKSGLEDIQQAFNALSHTTRKIKLNTSVSKLSGTAQRMTDASKLRFCIPIEVVKNSADIVLTLNKLGILSPVDRKARIPFELVITGVTKEDIETIKSLNRNHIKQALDLPDKVTVSMITEDQIQARAKWMCIDGTDTKIRAEIVKQLSLELRPLTQDECMAIVTDAVSEDKAQGLKEQLKPELEEGISIRILIKPETGKSMFSLSTILNDWLEDIQNGAKSTIKIILPTLISPAEMIEQIDKAIRNAWRILSAA